MNDLKSRYLLLVDYGSEGWYIEYYETAEELLKAVYWGRTSGQKFLIARELKLEIKEEQNDE